MTTLLQLNASLFESGGQSSRLVQRYVDAWRLAHPGSPVIVREVGGDAVPHLTQERFQAFLAQPDARTPGQQAIAGFSDTLVDELRAADTIVLGLPLYNFGVPSSLKAYFDHVARAGVTFRYTERGPVGLLTGKKAIVVATRGGKSAGTPVDSQTGFVRDFLHFLGIEDVTFVYAEGLAMGDAARDEALERAQRTIDALAITGEERLAA